MRNKNIINTVRSRLKQGFTIVELIVVITIIGILTGIVIVSYSGWKTTTITNQLKSDLNGVAAAMENSRTFGNIYPAIVPSTFVPSSGVTLSGGSLNSGASYCVSAANGSQSYFISAQYSTPLVGICPSLYLDASIKASYTGNGTAWTDLSGNSNNGTLYGGASYSNTNGGIISFDGVSGYVSIPNKMSGEIGTICFFMKDNGSGAWSDIFTIDTGVDGTSSRVENTAGGNYSWYGQGGFTAGPTIFTHNGTQWDYISLTFDGTTARSYKDGVLVYQSSISGNFPAAANINIGRRMITEASFWKGNMANFAIYNVALSASGVQQNFNALRGRYGI